MAFSPACLEISTIRIAYSWTLESEHLRNNDMTRIGREGGALQKLIEAAKDIGLDPGRYEVTKERLASMLGKQEIEVEAGGVKLSAWLSEKLWLTVSVSVTQGWNQQVEEQLYQSLKQRRRITAMLVMAEWPEICALCQKQSSPCSNDLN